ncbi:MAG: ankyrin repeat domain-containing protein [Treponema sp.]
MKVVIFYEQTEKKTSEAIERIISAHSCAVICHQTDEIWNAAKYTNPPALLQDITHILLIFGERGIDDPAFIFFSGMGIGKNLPVLILKQKAEHRLPDNCKNLAVPLTVDTFEDYFIKEQKNFLAIERKRAARMELLNLGYPCFDVNFIGAVKEGQTGAVQLFLDAGFDASLRDTRGTPVLSLAVRESQYDTAVLLLSYGAEINLCAEDRSYSALMEAAQLGDLRTAHLLLSKNADTNIQSKDGQTALILAVGRQDIPMVKLLIENNADWTITDHLGMSALGYAKLFNNKEIIALMQNPL